MPDYTFDTLVAFILNRHEAWTLPLASNCLWIYGSEENDSIPAVIKPDHPNIG